MCSGNLHGEVVFSVAPEASDFAGEFGTAEFFFNGSSYVDLGFWDIGLWTEVGAKGRQVVL